MEIPHIDLSIFPTATDAATWFMKCLMHMPKKHAESNSKVESTTYISTLPFFTPDPPCGTIEYASSVSHCNLFESSIYIYAFILGFRVYKTKPEIFHYQTLYKIFATLLMLSYKMLSDEPQTMETFSHVFGIEWQELHTLEIEILGILKYNTFVSFRLFTRTINSMRQKV